MAELPAGTVTFLFTDVEGSTRLLHELGSEPYAAALAEHRRLLRRAFAGHGGVEVDTQGDSFFVAFAEPQAAAAAAAEGQTAVAAAPIAVRMGLHTGRPLITDGSYVGIDVHKAARICAAGHGGQVLVSDATCKLLGDVALRSLGLHRLKDFAEPEPLYQLGSGDFGPLKSLGQSNLPEQPTAFLGRELELQEVLSLLEQPDARLLTLTGPGGSGKTRLALRAAASVVDSYPYGVWWVGLQAVRDPELVMSTIASTLGARDDLAEHIAENRTLLVLDNLEQLLEAVPSLAELLAKCPNLRLLVTSRERLRLSAEREYPVPPFVPEEGIGFFLARAREVQPTVRSGEPVAEICRRLDHLPLALELAAARLKVLSPEHLLSQIDDGLPVLSGGPRDAPERQRTLRATIQWSYDLLAPQERRVLARLGVFSGGWAYAAAEAVADADLDTLQSLVDKSLVRFDGSRYSMLETIRAYAEEQLAGSGERERVRRRHAVYFAELAESSGLAVDAEGPERYDLVLPERDNISAVLDWALEQDQELGLRLAVGIEHYWMGQGAFEAVHRVDALLGRADDLPGELRAAALRTLGGATFIVGHFEEGSRLHEQSLAEYRRLGDARGAAICLERLARWELVQGNLEQARSLCDEARAAFRRAQYRKGEGIALDMLGEITFAEGNHEEAFALFERSAAVCEETGLRWFQGVALVGLAERNQEIGRYEDAGRWARAALDVVSQISDRQSIVYSLAILARSATERGDQGRAGLLWGALERETEGRPVGQWERQGEGEQYAAALLARTGAEFERARQEGRRLSLDAAVELALAEA